MLARFGREKQAFREYLFRKEQLLRFQYEKERYEIQINEETILQGKGKVTAETKAFAESEFEKYRTIQDKE